MSQAAHLLTWHSGESLVEKRLGGWVRVRIPVQDYKSLNVYRYDRQTDRQLFVLISSASAQQS